MLEVSSPTHRGIVKALFVASCLLSIVSYYTTQQGMALYLAPWFSVLAALGVQTALLMVAWLIGFTRANRVLLVAVYTITAVVSICFSYVSLHTWFTMRSRPAEVQRKLYDELHRVAGRSEEVLSAASAEEQKHALALEEMTAAEKSHGLISRARDADPYLDQVREAVAREAQTYSGTYREGSGAGLRYTAFDRYAKLARQSLTRIEESRRALAAFRADLKPYTPADQQIRKYQQATAAISWPAIEQSLHQGPIERPASPQFAAHVDQSVSGQEDLLRAFEELFTAPTSRHLFAFGLASFIDIIVFLLAYASGPYFFGSPEQRWLAAGATLDASDLQVFARDLLRKIKPDEVGLPVVAADELSAGERQICLLLASRGMALAQPRDGRLHYLFDREIHERLLEVLSSPDLPLRAAAHRAAAGA